MFVLEKFGMGAAAAQMMCSHAMTGKETAVELSDPPSSPRELFLGGTGTRILLQEPAMCCAHHVFDQMPQQIGKLDNSDIEQGNSITWFSEGQVIPDAHEVFDKVPIEVV